MNKLTFLAFTLVLGIALFAIVINDVGVDKIASAILSLKLWHFAALTVLYGIGFLVSAYRWKLILNANGNFASFGKILAARMVGHSINYLTPSGLVMGEPFKAMVLAGENNIKLGPAMVSVVVEGAVFLSSLLFVVIVGTFSFITYSGISSKILFATAGALAFLTAVFYLFYAKMIKKSSLEEKGKGFFTYIIDLARLNKFSFINNLKEKIAKGEAEVKNFFFLHRNVVLAAVFLSLAEIVIMLAAHWLAISFLGYAVSIRILLGIFSLMSIANLLPLPGALGGFELSQIFAFSFFGLGGQVTALAFSMIARIINLIYVIAGIAYLIHFEIKLISGRIIELVPKFKEAIKNFFKNA